MVHGSLQEFDLAKEWIYNFIVRFEFYCTANNFRGEGEHARKKKSIAYSYAELGDTFAKLKELASPAPFSDLTLDAIMGNLLGHYRPQTIIYLFIY